MKTTPDCLFCNIIAGTIACQKIYEDDRVLAFLDIKPISQGHTLIVPKRHSDSFLTLHEDDLRYCMLAVKKIAPHIAHTVHADGFNLGINTGSAAGQVIMHTHLHIIPRFAKDGLKSWPNKTTTSEELEQVKRAILDEFKEKKGL